MNKENTKKILIYISEELQNKIRELRKAGYNMQVQLRKAITEKVNQLLKEN